MNTVVSKGDQSTAGKKQPLRLLSGFRNTFKNLFIIINIIKHPTNSRSIFSFYFQTIFIINLKFLVFWHLNFGCFESVFHFCVCMFLIPVLSAPRAYPICLPLQNYKWWTRTWSEAGSSNELGVFCLFTGEYWNSSITILCVWSKQLKNK